MKTLTITRALLTTAFVLSLSATAFASNIATIEAAANGTTGVTMDSGVVTAIYSVPGTYGVYTPAYYAFAVQDSSGSLVIDSKLAGLGYTPTIGDSISVSGTITFYHQIPELGTQVGLTLLSQGNSVPTPLVTTIPQINIDTLPQSLEGYYMELQNVTIGGAPATFPTSGTGTYSVSDGVNTMQLFWWPTSYSIDALMQGQPVPTGTVDIYGFASVYNNTTPEFVPTMIVQVPEPTTGLWLLGGCGLLVWNVIRRRK